jgi:hypothetical protein
VTFNPDSPLPSTAQAIVIRISIISAILASVLTSIFVYQNYSFMMFVIYILFGWELVGLVTATITYVLTYFTAAILCYVFIEARKPSTSKNKNDGSDKAA